MKSLKKKNLLRILKKNWFSLAVLFIILLAAGFRFYHFPTRWNLATDQAHDAMIGREAVRQKKLPLRGPFASGANVIGGPQWYWVITFFTWLYPKSILSPWLGLTFLYLVFVFLMIKLGEELGGKSLALITGLITAFSPMQVSQGVALTNQSPMAFVSAFSLWAMVKYLKAPQSSSQKKKSVYAFIFGTGLALAFNIHLQGIGLLFLIPVVAVLGWPHSWQTLFWFGLGFGLQFIPMLIFEFQKGFYNLQGFIAYFLFDRHRTGTPSRWLTYVFTFWPNLWTKMVGGHLYLSFFQGIAISLLAGWFFFKKKLAKPILAVILGFILIFISLRYYQGPRYESYHVFLHPFVFLLSAWLINQLWQGVGPARRQQQKLAAGLLLIFLLLGAFKLNLDHYRVEKNGLYPQMKIWQKKLMARFPGEKFALYAYQFHSLDKTKGLSLVLSLDNLIADDGIKIGISDRKIKGKELRKTVTKKTFFRDGRYALSNISEIKVEGDDWALMNPSEIWKGTEEW